MKIGRYVRLVKEDFPQDQQELIGKLAFSLNPYLEQVSQILTKNIDYENLNREILSIEVTVDASGIPTTSLELKHSLKSRPRGIICLAALNNTDSTPLTGAPFVAVTFGNDTTILKVSNIFGLPAGKKFTLTLEVIG